MFLSIVFHISESNKDQKFGCRNVNDLRHNKRPERPYPVLHYSE